MYSVTSLLPPSGKIIKSRGEAADGAPSSLHRVLNSTLIHRKPGPPCGKCPLRERPQVQGGRQHPCPPSSSSLLFSGANLMCSLCGSVIASAEGRRSTSVQGTTGRAEFSCEFGGGDGIGEGLRLLLFRYSYPFWVLFI